MFDYVEITDCNDDDDVDVDVDDNQHMIIDNKKEEEEIKNEIIKNNTSENTTPKTKKKIEKTSTHTLLENLSTYALVTNKAIPKSNSLTEKRIEKSLEKLENAYENYKNSNEPSSSSKSRVKTTKVQHNKNDTSFFNYDVFSIDDMDVSSSSSASSSSKMQSSSFNNNQNQSNINNIRNKLKNTINRENEKRGKTKLLDDDVKPRNKEKPSEKTDDDDDNIYPFEEITLKKIIPTISDKIQETIRKQMEDDSNVASSSSLKKDDFCLDLFETFASEFSEHVEKKSKQNIGSNGSTSNGTTNHLPKVPILTRSYISNFLREPDYDEERECLKGKNCISIQLMENYTMRNTKDFIEPFILREFLLPEEVIKVEELKKEYYANIAVKNNATVKNREIEDESFSVISFKHFLNERIPEKKFCILCNRFMTHILAIRKSSGNGFRGKISIIQTHGNRFDVNGEYKSSAMIQTGRSFNGLIHPIMRYDMNDYFPGTYNIYQIKNDTNKIVTSLKNYNDEVEDRKSVSEKILKRRNNIGENSTMIFKKTLRGWCESNSVIFETISGNHSELQDSSSAFFGTPTIDSGVLALSREYTLILHPPKFGEILFSIFGLTDMDYYIKKFIMPNFTNTTATVQDKNHINNCKKIPNEEYYKYIKLKLFERDSKKFKSGEWIIENERFINNIFRKYNESIKEPLNLIDYIKIYQTNFFVYSPMTIEIWNIIKNVVDTKQKLKGTYNFILKNSILYLFNLPENKVIYQWNKNYSMFFITINFIKWIFSNAFIFTNKIEKTSEKKSNNNHISEGPISFSTRYSSYRLSFSPILENPRLVHPKQSRFWRRIMENNNHKNSDLVITASGGGDGFVNQNENDWQEEEINKNSQVELETYMKLYSTLNPWNLHSLVKDLPLQQSILFEFLEEFFEYFEAKLLTAKDKLLCEHDDIVQETYNNIFISEYENQYLINIYEDKLDRVRQINNRNQIFYQYLQPFPKVNLANYFLNLNLTGDVRENNQEGKDGNAITSNSLYLYLNYINSGEIPKKIDFKFNFKKDQFDNFSIRLYYDFETFIPKPNFRSNVHCTYQLKDILEKKGFNGFDTYESLHDELINEVILQYSVPLLEPLNIKKTVDKIKEEEKQKKLIKKMGIRKSIKNTSFIKQPIAENSINNLSLTTTENIKIIKKLNLNSRVYKWWFLNTSDKIYEDIKKSKMDFFEIMQKPFIEFVKNKIHNTYCSSIKIASISHYLTYVYLLTLLSSLFTHYEEIIKKSIIQYLKKPKIYTNIDKMFLFSNYSKEERNNHQKIYETSHLYMTAFFQMTEHFFSLISDIGGNEHDDNTTAAVDNNLQNERLFSKINNENILSSLDYILPSVEKCTYWSYTNSIDKIIGKLNFWNVNNDNMDGFLSLFCKSLPFSYQKRSIDKKVPDFCSNEPSIKQFILSLIKFSIFGIYPDMTTFSLKEEKDSSSSSVETNHSKKRIVKSVGVNNLPLIYKCSFVTMFYYYRLFFMYGNRSGMKYNFETILWKWILDESNMTSLILREFLCFFLGSKPQFQLSQTVLNWKNVWYKTIISLNILRNIVDQSIIHYQILEPKTMLKIIKSSFHSSDINEIEKMVKKHFLPNLLSSKNYFSPASTIYCSHNEFFLQRPRKLSFLNRLYKDLNNFYNDLLVQYILTSEKIMIDKMNNVKENEFDRNYLDTIIEDPSPEYKKLLWLFFTKKLSPKLMKNLNLSQERGIYNFISVYDGYILFIIKEMYRKNIKNVKILKMLSEFSIYTIKVLIIILNVLMTIKQSSITIQLPEDFAIRIDKAMMKRFNLISEKEIVNVDTKRNTSEIVYNWNLPEKFFDKASSKINQNIFKKQFYKAFYCYQTICCKTICNYSLYTRIYGHRQLLYDPNTKQLVCGRKKTKKTEETNLSNFNLKDLVNPIFLKSANIRGEEDSNKIGKAINKHQNNKYPITKKEENQNNQRKSNNNIIMDYETNNEHNDKCLPFTFEEIKKHKIKKMINHLLLSKVKLNSFVLKELPLKTKRKIARRFKEKTNFDCSQNPPVLAIDLHHKGLVAFLSSISTNGISKNVNDRNIYSLFSHQQNKEPEEANLFIHCPRCANLHLFSFENWHGNMYFCVHCWTEIIKINNICDYCEKSKSIIPENLNIYFKYSKEFLNNNPSLSSEKTMTTTAATNSASVHIGSKTSLQLPLIKKTTGFNKFPLTKNQDSTQKIKGDEKYVFSNFISSFLNSNYFDEYKDDIAMPTDNLTSLTDSFDNLLKDYNKNVFVLWNRGNNKDRQSIIFDNLKNQGHNLLKDIYKRDQVFKKKFIFSSLSSPTSLPTSSIGSNNVISNNDDHKMSPNFKLLPSSSLNDKNNRENRKDSLGKYKPKKLLSDENKNPMFEIVQRKAKNLVNYTIIDRLIDRANIKLFPLMKIISPKLFVDHRCRYYNYHCLRMSVKDDGQRNEEFTMVTSERPCMVTTMNPLKLSFNYEKNIQDQSLILHYTELCKEDFEAYIKKYQLSNKRANGTFFIWNSRYNCYFNFMEFIYLNLECYPFKFNFYKK